MPYLNGICMRPYTREGLLAALLCTVPLKNGRTVRSATEPTATPAALKRVRRLRRRYPEGSGETPPAFNEQRVENKHFETNCQQWVI